MPTGFHSFNAGPGGKRVKRTHLIYGMGMINIIYIRQLALNCDRQWLCDNWFHSIYAWRSNKMATGPFNEGLGYKGGKSVTMPIPYTLQTNTYCRSLHFSAYACGIIYMYLTLREDITCVCIFFVCHHTELTINA